MKLLIILLLTIPSVILASLSEADYNKLRSKTIEDDDKSHLGSSTALNAIEQQVNKILMDYKNKEFAEGVSSLGRLFPSSEHFFHAKERIEGSNIFQIIQMLPKGGNLHLHLSPSIDVNYAIENLTRWDNLYYCVNEAVELTFGFADKIDSLAPCTDNQKWEKVSDLYKEASSDSHVHSWFRSMMSMITPTPQIEYPNGKVAWELFEKKITTLGGIVKHDAALKDAFYQVLQNHYDDNVMYLEMRSSYSSIYRLDQSRLSIHETIQLLLDVVKDFKAKHPDFWGVKFIRGPHRFRTVEKLKKLVEETLELKAKFPEHVVGFDLVGQEDKGFPLLKFIPHLLDGARQNLDFFFHSGETNWYGTTIDENLVDALLLPAKRLGHAFALYRHPHLYELAKKNGIAVELCPISNQILRHIEDLRVHPSAMYLREGFPVVVGSDDPGLWATTPLSHDFYIAFMAIAGQKADLRFLKQLALNSIKYSAMSKADKDSSMKKFEESWTKALNKIIAWHSSERKH